MYIDISVKISAAAPAIDLSIDERKMIKDLIVCLQEMELIQRDVKLISSLKNGRVTDISKTFKEANITSGDLISVV